MKKKITFSIFVLCVVLVVTALTLVACNKDDLGGLVKPQNIKYDGTTITWDKVAVANYYYVSINGGDNQRVNSNTFTYDAGNKEFTAKITAVNSVADLSTEKTFYPLEKVTNVQIGNDGTISWSEVNGANEYIISVNGEVMQDTVSTNFFDALNEGSNRISIKASVKNDDSYFSYWSDDINLYIHYAPNKIKYDGEKITWTGNAPQYEININGQKTEVNETSFVYDSNNLDFDVEIKALGNYASTFDSKISVMDFHYLDSVRNVNVVDGVLCWDKVAGANEYKLKINGVIQNVKITDNEYGNLTTGTSLDVQLLPYAGDNYFSNWTESKTVYILESPVLNWNSDLELDGLANNNLTWDLVNGAAGYSVETTFNGNVTNEDFSAMQASYANAYISVGVYEIRVKALSLGDGTYSDSKYSDTIKIERLAAPKAVASGFIVSDASNLKNGFTVNYQAVSNASSYQLYKDGVLLSGKESTGLSITDNAVAGDSVITQQEYTYMVKSIGSVKNIGSMKYVTLSCLSDSALSFNITVQAMPTGFNMSGFNANWNPVTGNNGYAVKYAATVIGTNTELIDLSTIKAGTYSVSVCTKGNGSAVLASNFTAEASIVRLAAPTGIKITYGSGEGLLNFDSVSYAKSYQTFIDASGTSIPESSFDNMYQFIKESGTTLNMIAVANYYNELGTIYYMTSEASATQQFIRLAAPTFPEGALSNSKELLWNASSNINTQEYTPTYAVYEGGVMQTGGVQNATKFNIEYLDGGMSYTFKVKAVGNDSKYLDSEMSNSITVYKLATPVLNISDGAYVWTTVANASSYVLEIDGQIVDNDIHVSGSTYSYIPLYNTIGTHTVKLYAAGDGYNNINSNNCVYYQVVKALLAPEIEFSYSSDEFVNGGKITVNITTPSENAKSYQYEIAGESATSSDLTYSKTIESTGTYYIKVKAVGGNFDSSDNYYIDSQYVGGNDAYKIVLLAPPTFSTFSINSDGVIKWGTVSGANGYDYYLACGDEDYPASYSHVAAAALNPISDYSSYQTIKIKVRAYGGNVNTVSSSWIEYIWTNPKM
ncbi:MAG: hypothetical protein ACI4MT_04955 [Christensenellales bacterium]